MVLENPPASQPLDVHDPDPAGPQHGRPPHEGAESMSSSSKSEGYNSWPLPLPIRSGQVEPQPNSLPPPLPGNQTAEDPTSAVSPATPLQVTATANTSTTGSQEPHWPNQPAQQLHHGHSPMYDSHFRSPSGSHPGSNVASQFQSNNPFLKAVQQQNSDNVAGDSPASAITPTAPTMSAHNGLENVMPPPRPQSASSSFLHTTHAHPSTLNKSYTGPNPSYPSHTFPTQTQAASPPIIPPKEDMPDGNNFQQQDHTTGYAASENTANSTHLRDVSPHPSSAQQPNVEPSSASTSNDTISHDLIDLGDDDGTARAQSDGSSWHHPADSGGTTSLGGSDGLVTPFDANSEAHQGTRQPSGLTPPESSQPEPSRPTPMTESQIRQREAILAETYDIRIVNWTDGTTDLRRSPVLVQNENGPCPLLALVNGLVLRTPPDARSPLVRTLNSKEKISVSLLIYAIFDELTTYVDEESQLPDIEALSSFLTVLHTGMNVNPRLTPTAGSPGTFLETHDTNLYRTFNLPLVHGWLAPPNSAAHSALVRVAEYHDDIQLLYFQKEELEDKASRGDPLSADDMQLIQDIECIQHFVNEENATQLSRFGLDHLNRTTAPGSISILFRNDHFSTLFKHPSSHQLFTLVTDMGFSRHAEIVWESFVDINGSESELFSGDFRPVGHGPSSSSLGSQNNQRNETAAASSSANKTSRTDKSATGSTEQMDADYAFALALQFQDEEEQRTRGNQQNESNRGRSNTHTQSTSTLNRPRPTGRRSTGQSQHNGQSQQNSQSQQNVRTLIPHREPNAPGDDPNAPPPTYEQASKAPVYNPPADHPQYAGPPSTQRRPLLPGGVAGPRTTSQGFASAPAPGGRRMPGPGPSMPMDRLQQGPAPDFHERPPRERDRKDCIVM